MALSSGNASYPLEPSHDQDLAYASHGTTVPFVSPDEVYQAFHAAGYGFFPGAFSG
jgi:hypothetical protein